MRTAHPVSHVSSAKASYMPCPGLLETQSGRSHKNVRSFDDIRRTVLILLMAGYFVLSYPFMQLRIPPTGFGVPFGELALACVLVTFNLPRLLSRMGTIVFLPPLLLWWGWGFARLAVDAAREGAWAFRDGTQLIESLFLIVGFGVVANADDLSQISRWMRRIVAVACLYGLLFVFQWDLIAISPTLPGGSDQPIPVIGTFATTGTVLLLGAFMCMAEPPRTRRGRFFLTLVGGFLVSYAVLVIQMRTTYVQLLCLTGLLLLVRPRALGRLASTVPLFCILLALISAFNLRISGRLSSEIGWAFIFDHLQAVFGIGTKGSIGEAASGVSLRFGWWLRLYDQLTSDMATLVSGLGFGVALTDFRDTLGVLAREPHNSLVSVIARLGLVGGICWIWIQVDLFLVAYRAYRGARALGWQNEAQFVLLVMAFAVLTLASCLGEDVMEKPYNAIPYYALWGVVLRVAYLVKSSSITVGARSPGLGFAAGT